LACAVPRQRFPAGANPARQSPSGSNRSSHAYRPGRNAQQAAVEVEETLFRGHPEVVDADLADYFGSIPHAELMLSLARRIVDRRVLHLIKMWLECAVTIEGGRRVRPKPRISAAAFRKGLRSHRCWLKNCLIPCDHVPYRSWPLFRARELMREVIETFRREQSR